MSQYIYVIAHIKKVISSFFRYTSNQGGSTQNPGRNVFQLEQEGSLLSMPTSLGSQESFSPGKMPDIAATIKFDSFGIEAPEPFEVTYREIPLDSIGRLYIGHLSRAKKGAAQLNFSLPVEQFTALGLMINSEIMIICTLCSRDDGGSTIRYHEDGAETLYIRDVEFQSQKLITNQI
jgi:hypothetical protein